MAEPVIRELEPIEIEHHDHELVESTLEDAGEVLLQRAMVGKPGEAVDECCVREPLQLEAPCLVEPAPGAQEDHREERQQAEARHERHRCRDEDETLGVAQGTEGDGRTRLVDLRGVQDQRFDPGVDGLELALDRPRPHMLACPERREDLPGRRHIDTRTAEEFGGKLAIARVTVLLDVGETTDDAATGRDHARSHVGRGGRLVAQDKRLLFGDREARLLVRIDERRPLVHDAGQRLRMDRGPTRKRGQQEQNGRKTDRCESRSCALPRPPPRCLLH